jgi:hypothetical protein
MSFDPITSKIRLLETNLSVTSPATHFIGEANGLCTQSGGKGELFVQHSDYRETADR